SAYVVAAELLAHNSSRGRREPQPRTEYLLTEDGVVRQVSLEGDHLLNLAAREFREKDVTLILSQDHSWMFLNFNENSSPYSYEPNDRRVRINPRATLSICGSSISKSMPSIDWWKKVQEYLEVFCLFQSRIGIFETDTRVFEAFPEL